MRQSLQERIATGLETQPLRRDEQAKLAQAKLVEDFARILRETADAAAAARPGGPAEELERKAHFELPQILQPKPVARTTSRPAMDWFGTLTSAFAGALVGAPMTTLLAVVGFALVGLVWRGDITFLEPQSDWSQASLTELLEPSTAAANIAVQSVRTVAVGTPAGEKAVRANPEALATNAERLIGEGKIAAARELLARAALSGDAAARFALAETFDPIVLAAWGVRGISADPGTAKLLYEQALAAGDTRAERRLKALKAD
jgi:hypothetical protein